MNFIIKLLFAVLFLGVVGLFLFKTPDGKPILSTEKISNDAK